MHDAQRVEVELKLDQELGERRGWRDRAVAERKVRVALTLTRPLATFLATMSALLRGSDRAEEFPPPPYSSTLRSPPCISSITTNE